MKSPFFSIIIPSYNRAHMLPAALQSVQDQTFPDWESIIVDDGSTDNTKELVKDWIAKDNRFRYIYQENAERSAARNNGIKNAKGQYICFLDSDDYYLDNHLLTLNSFLKDNNFPISLTFTNYIALKDNKAEEVKTTKLYSPEIHYLMFNAIIPARVCIHKNILKRHLFDEDIVIAEDIVLWVKIANEFPVFHINKATVKYNLHLENSINLKNDAAIKRLKGLKKFFTRYPNIRKKFARKQRQILLSDTIFNIAKHHIYNNRKLKALKYILLSILKTPIHSQNKHKLYCIIKLLTGNRPSEYK